MAIILSDYIANISMRGGREGGKKRRTDGREGRMGGRDVMTIMAWVHMAWNGCIIGNPSEAG